MNKDNSETNFNCKICNLIDTDDMVMCDNCDQWFHFGCVGVNSSVEHEDWNCSSCQTKKQSASSVSNAETENTQDNCAPILNQPKTPAAMSPLNNSRQLNMSKAKYRELRLQQLQEEKEMKEKSDREFLKKKYDLLQQLASDSSLNPPSDDEENINAENNPDRFPNKIYETTTTTKINSTPVQRNAQQHQSTILLNPQMQHPLIAASSILNATSGQQPTASQTWNSTSIETAPPNKQQMAARQVMARDYVTFSGRPEEWPLFISWFHNTTTSCGFTNADNLRRLQNCLKGEALHAVRNRLLIPEQVPSVLNTLQIHFGQPEVIIDNLLEQIRKEPPPRQEKLQTIIKFSLAVQNICGVMEATGLRGHLENPSLLRELTNKLPPAIRLDWGNHRKNLSVVNLSTYSSWLEGVAHAALIVNPLHEQQPSTSNGRNGARAAVHVHQDTQIQPTQIIKKCLLCTSDCKTVDQCPTFLNMTINERWNVIKRFTICRTCLRQHGRSRCYIQRVCGTNGCVFKHHQLLHKPREQPNSFPTVNADHHFHQKLKTDQILFRIVPIILHNEEKQINTYAFLDDGSSVSLVDENLAAELGVEGIPQPLCLKWTSNTHRTEHSSRNINIQISSSTNTKKYNITNVRTVKSLELPKQTVIFSELSDKYEYLKDIPIESYRNAQPRILLGLSHWKLSVPLQTREGRENEPIAAKTRLGWTIYGPCMQPSDTSIQITNGNFHICECQQIGKDLNAQFKDYITLESIGTKNFQLKRSHDDEKAIQILKNDTIIEGNKYVVPLLWKVEPKQIPDTRVMAESRLKCLQRKMERDPKLNENLHTQIEEYVNKGYARKLSDAELKQNKSLVWYLPIFPVHNHNKPDKVRLVWDAAATVNGISLNSMLLSGPDIVPSLLSVLFRFRQKKIAICADIKEMFHQVGIKREDQDFQRFLWLSKESKNIEEYVMKVMTFGSTCSPFCAQFIKNENARKYEKEYPRAVKGIIENHYVDDYLDSTDSEEEALQIANEIIFIHSRAGFTIRNFMSNSESVLENLKEKAAHYENDETNWSILSRTEKILGMWWCPAEDTFLFKMKVNTLKSDILTEDIWPTKRDVLKVMMSVFDPLGLIANFMVLLKIILQEIWSSSIEWDEKILPQQVEKWKKWKHLIPSIKNIFIPRAYLKHPFCQDWHTEVHVFVDASEVAYSAVGYLRVTNGNAINCILVAAKTKIAPLKVISIPRLELEAAVLGTRLAKTIIEGHSIKIKEKYFWSDSKTVLSWINSDHRKYKQFVAFRIGEILEETEMKDWRWVPSKDNVADEATKWQFKTEFSSNSRWYSGPKFLKNTKDDWPAEFISTGVSEVELRHVHLHQVKTFDRLIDVNRFSKWTKMLRCMAQVYRFLRLYLNYKNDKTMPKSLISDDLNYAENFLHRLCQREVFPEEISVLNHVENKIDRIDKTSVLYKLSPYLDEHSVLRILGRIDAAPGIPISMKRPIILPKEHQITRLIIANFHERFHHHNDETVVNELRQKYNIPRIRVLLKSIKRQCQHCKIKKCLPSPPLMGNLPAARLQAFTKPFTYIGIDYFGPLYVKVGRRLEKRWGVLITCLTIRAVHIEIAGALSADSCIMALKRFISRRGWPLEIYSDNGTNFRGASHELKEAMQNLDQGKIAEGFVGPNLKWHFNPPLAPHMGGSWERLVRSVKQTLCHICPQRNPTEELLQTMFSEVERIINSRPLTYVSLDGGDAEALTPNHFLLGSSSGEKMDGVILSESTSLRKNWLASEQFANQFWRRWVAEYLPDLTKRTKWFSSTRSIQEGDIVIITDPNSPRNSWPKGIILKVLPGKDGVVRQAIVKTKTGVYTRPATKLAVLDVGRF